MANLLQRSSFARGWVPDADAVNGPVDGLLRMDNLVLDELGVVALRAGSVKVNGSPFADADVHSLFTAILNATRYRFAGAGNAIYVNGASLTSVGGAGDVAFGSHLGQVLFARGSSTKKYDGAALRNWGIPMTGGAPTIAPVVSDGKTFASFDSGESPAFSVDEDDSTGATFVTGEDGTANGAFALHPNTTTNRGSITKAFAAATDFTAYDSGGAGTDNDLLQFWVYLSEPADLLGVTLMIDVNPASASLFQDDYYTHTFVPGDETPLGPTTSTELTPSLANQGTSAAEAVSNLGDRGGTGAQSRVPVADFSPAKPVVNAGWSKLSVRRGDMTRQGSTSGKDWTTVKAVRLVVTMTSASLVAFDALRIIANPLNGSYKWLYVLAYNSGTYVGLSAPSPLSTLTQMQAQGATVTIPADGGRDPQANECWLYRFGGVMDAFYRTAVKTGISGTGAFDISDLVADLDAMVEDLKLETDNGVPPAGILGIAGPYFDRTYVLTSTSLAPSRQLNPDSFAAGQVVTIAGADETAYWVKKALGGLYVGTSRDIYLIEGTGAELPDGTIDLVKRPLNIDHPPINDAVVQDGNLLIYFAEDGWRAVSGGGSTLLTGDTSLLYRGQTRHGLGPINTTTGRFRAAISKGQLVTLLPMGAETTSTARVGRQVPARSSWYYHAYPQAFRCVYREPDGTLLASDAAGTVWQLDTGTDDNGALIPLTIWTKVDDDGAAYTRKKIWDLRARMDTGGAASVIALHLDGSATPAAAVPTALNSPGIAVATLDAIPAFVQAQYRITAACNTFRFYDIGLGGALLPAPIRGLQPKTNAGYSGVKTLSGFRIRLCTRGETRIVTVHLDNAAVSQTFSLLTGASDPDDLTLAFTAAQTARDIALSFDSDVEVYEWSPIVSASQPLGVTAWDSGPIDLGDREIVWLRRIDMKVRAGAPLSIVAWLDGAPVATLTLSPPAGVDTVVPVDVPRGTKGRQPRLVVTSSAPFFPYWLKVIERVTGLGTEKPMKTLPVTLGGGAG